MITMKFSSSFCAAVLCAAAGIAAAKPIAFQDGWSIMAEYGGPTMREAQAFYAPQYWWSFGPGVLNLKSEDKLKKRDITYLQATLLPKRWNLEDGQGNIFLFGGPGAARGNDFNGTRASLHYGAQADFETLWFYSSAKTDAHRSRTFSHRIDTLQLGVAPYAHEFDTLATWFLIQARRYTGGIADGTETAALIRLFKRNVWFEIGVTNDRKLQAMLMVNY